MIAYLFPGQGAQYPGMARPLLEQHSNARAVLEQANETLGFDLMETMLNGSAADLKQTHITQPAVFVHTIATWQSMDPDLKPDMVAGHSLGEFSALCAAGALPFEGALKLVHLRAQAMQEACLAVPSTMAAIMGLEDQQVEAVCEDVTGIVVPANYNAPGQLVISGEKKAVEHACQKAKEAGAKRAVLLPVGGAFHSPLMDPARAQLREAIEAIHFSAPVCAVYQNVSATGETNPQMLKKRLIEQLTAPVRWHQSVIQMHEDGAHTFTEVGPGKVLQGLVKKIVPGANLKSFGN